LSWVRDLCEVVKRKSCQQIKLMKRIKATPTDYRWKAGQRIERMKAVAADRGLWTADEQGDQRAKQTRLSA
jgi:hypothetical protein